MSAKGIFASFLQAGFECSTHRLKNGRRLDLVASTAHDRFAREDYRALHTFGIRTVREGLRWHLIESVPGRYDFSTFQTILDAAQQTGTELITDLFHFGWPDHIDIFRPEFVSSFAEFSHAFARMLRRQGVAAPFIAPMNEMSFVAWGGGDVEYINPFQRGRGPELKRQLVRAAAAATAALWSELPDARMAAPEPVIHIAGNPDIPGDEQEAERYRCSQFEAWDMLSGRLHPELGGRPEYLDIIGVNYYDRNQWVHNGVTLLPGDAQYRPFHQILLEVWQRYGRPIFVSETGTENEARANWFAYICDEVRFAMERGVPMHGICLYPILNHPGWDDDRHCHNGLFDYAAADGSRELFLPLAGEIQKQTHKFEKDQVMVHDTACRRDEMDLICFSHLRWGFVFQRPQHLMSRFARQRRVYFIEEPVYEGEQATLRSQVCAQTGVRVATPVLPHSYYGGPVHDTVKGLVSAFLAAEQVDDFIAWYYTPMALDYCPDLRPVAAVYDCMDELAMFKNAPPELCERETELFRRADLVFTGGVSLFEAKRSQHPHVHAFPSSVDVPHFAQARSITECPEDMRGIPHPRIGYAGVIDERIDLDLIREVAELRPDWQIVMLGPVVKIAPDSLPRAANIHYLGMKAYQDLPAYFSGWDLAIMPFALNDATRFISPTKTPEYLAAGLPVVSTPIRDVVHSYGELGLARIAHNAAEFVDAADHAMTYCMGLKWRERADAFLQTLSWDKTWNAMNKLIERVIEGRQGSGVESEWVGNAHATNHPEAAHV